MAKQQRPEIISARVTAQEKAWIKAVAASEEIPLAEAIWRLVVPAARRRLLEELSTAEGGRVDVAA